MGQAVAVRTDYTASEVRRLAKRAKDAAQARRLLAIAAVFDGASRAAAAKIGGMDRQTLRDWVIRFNRQGPDGLFNIPSPGVPPKLDATHRAFLARIVEEGPIPAVHGAASISRSISASIRYSRVRSSALGRLRGRTVRFSIPDTSVVTSVFPMQIPHPGHALFREGASRNMQFLRCHFKIERVRFKFEPMSGICMKQCAIAASLRLKLEQPRQRAMQRLSVLKTDQRLH